MPLIRLGSRFTWRRQVSAKPWNKDSWRVDGARVAMFVFHSHLKGGPTDAVSEMAAGGRDGHGGIKFSESMHLVFDLNVEVAVNEVT